MSACTAQHFTPTPTPTDDHGRGTHLWQRWEMLQEWHTAHKARCAPLLPSFHRPPHCTVLQLSTQQRAPCCDGVGSDQATVLAHAESQSEALSTAPAKGYTEPQQAHPTASHPAHLFRNHYTSEDAGGAAGLYSQTPHSRCWRTQGSAAF